MGQIGTLGLVSIITLGSTKRQGFTITWIVHCSVNIFTTQKTAIVLISSRIIPSMTYKACVYLWYLRGSREGTCARVVSAWHGVSRSVRRNRNTNYGAKNDVRALAVVIRIFLWTRVAQRPVEIMVVGLRWIGWFSGGKYTFDVLLGIRIRWG